MFFEAQKLFQVLLVTSEQLHQVQVEHMHIVHMVHICSLNIIEYYSTDTIILLQSFHVESLPVP